MTIPDSEIFEYVATALNLPSERCHAGTAIDDLIPNSFQLVEVVIGLQDHFGTTFGQAELQRVRTLGDLARTIRNGLRSPSASP